MPHIITPLSLAFFLQPIKKINQTYLFYDTRHKMSSSQCDSLLLPLLHLSFFLLASIFVYVSHAIVPSERTFMYINEGNKLGSYAYDYMENYHSLPISKFPFTLCFYNTTPNAFVLALAMGDDYKESNIWWAWET